MAAFFDLTKLLLGGLKTLRLGYVKIHGMRKVSIFMQGHLKLTFFSESNRLLHC